jgi:hypothetical protein
VIKSTKHFALEGRLLRASYFRTVFQHFVVESFGHTTLQGVERRKEVDLIGSNKYSVPYRTVSESAEPGSDFQMAVPRCVPLATRYKISRWSNFQQALLSGH